nr:carbonic anhydrase, CA {internal peptide} {EC 4.2.1.1} [Coccomyxa, PA, Peptide Partial, 19 aa] [Coccomyxa]
EGNVFAQRFVGNLVPNKQA